MHTIWKGSISFGLVNIPIKMFAATEEKDIRFKYLHKGCNAPLKYKKVCTSCGKEVGKDDIVRGFEYEPGKYVIITEEDLEAVQSKTPAKSIEILDFVKLSQIDPVYFDKSYYLSPQDTGGKAYNLLREAMNTSGKIAIAKVTIRNKQTLAALRIYNNVIIMETIFYPDEIRPVSQVPGLPEEIQTDEKEMDIAIKLIDNLTEEFDAAKYTDDYRQALMDMIHKKIEGEEITVAPETRENNVIDLMEALQASLKKTDKKEPAKKKKTKSKQKRTAG